MSSLTQLRSEHAELVKIVRQWEVLIERDAPPPSVDLFGVRSRLSSLLVAHLKAEDWVLYPPLLESPDPEVARVARNFVDEMGGLAAAYNIFMERWDALSIQADWTHYQKEARAISQALGNRIVRENRDLYPLVERTDRAA
jgi:hemerythrin-like domain-containing protein